jgi:hypothetical protein
MTLADIVLARFADLSPDGLFTVVGGGVNRINAGGFPWSWGALFLLARIRLTVEEANRPHSTAVDRQTPSGLFEPIVVESPTLPLPPAAELGPDGMVGLSFNFCLMPVVFPEAGVYRYALKFDGNVVGVVDLLVASPTQGIQGR